LRTALDVRLRVLATALSALALGSSGCERRLESALPAPRAVRAVRAQRRDLRRKMTIPGNVVGYFQTTLLAHVAGYVKTVRFDKGDRVRAGEAIAEIDVPEVEADRGVRLAKLDESEWSVRRAEALLATARAAAKEAEAEVERARALAELDAKLHERAKKLFASSDLSLQDLEVAQGKREAGAADHALARAKLDAALAEVKRRGVEVELARRRVGVEEAELRQVDTVLDYATIRAPFDGVVTARWLDPGALVQRATRSEAAQPIVSVATLGRVRIQFETPQGEVAFVRSGTPVDLATDAFPGRVFHATVARTASSLWSDSRTMLSEAEYANAEGLLIPGLYVNVAVVLEERADAVVVPPEALVLSSGARGPWTVFVVEGGVARAKRVAKGWELERSVEITAGLDGGETVILGAGELHDFDRVSARLEPWRRDDDERAP
jgi:RND family efflux transporter MFP subunit